ncbi:winged helix-turn-helix domain-containing protein [Methanobrevibacter sp.]|uniref:winged helix-turn-helix domain-containing protein n=1 Tax=Methanobrevibacter sp. TaxID=66852 RepID=UPI00386B24CC
MDDETLKTYAYVNISSYRVKAVKALKGQVKIPTQIAKDTGIRKNHVSKVLRDLKESGVAECINEEARKGRLYRLTSMGDEIVDKLD